MEAPEERKGVHDAMPPIGAEIADKQGHGNLQPDRPGFHRRADAEEIHAMHPAGEESERHGENGGGEEAVDEVPGEIHADLFAPEFGGVQRTQALQRDEDGGEQGEPGGHAPGIEQEIPTVLLQLVIHGIGGRGAASARIARSIGDLHRPTQTAGSTSATTAATCTIWKPMQSAPKPMKIIQFRNVRD